MAKKYISEARMSHYFSSRRVWLYATFLLVLGVLFIGIAFSIYFVTKGARLGAMTAGIISWITLAFWLTDNIYTLSGHSLIASSPNMIMTIRNFIGIVIATFVVAASHNLFHKIRNHDL